MPWEKKKLKREKKGKNPSNDKKIFDIIIEPWKLERKCYIRIWNFSRNKT